MEYYTALEKLEWKAKSDREFEEEGLSIYNEHYTDVQVFTNLVANDVKEVGGAWEKLEGNHQHVHTRDLRQSDQSLKTPNK